MQGTQLLAGLPDELAQAACSIARTVAEEGGRAWIVGGTLRDMIAGREPKDLDMVSAVKPERVEQLFKHTYAVGKAFGTVIVTLDGVAIELTTFRSETGYGDGRRPDSVKYGDSLEVDALRRDFTCNALYLDPLNGELRDPTGGRGDIEAGVLRTVGAAAERFAEDGLRLLRMVRFQAAAGLEAAPGLHAAARASLAALRGVSAERVLAELQHIMRKNRSWVACQILEDCGILAACLPLWRAESAGGANEANGANWADVFAARMRALERTERDEVLGLGILLEVDPCGDGEARLPGIGTQILEELRASRQLREACRSLWLSRRSLEEVAQEGGERAARILLLRGEDGVRRLNYATAWAVALGRSGEELETLGAWCATLQPEDLRPARLLEASDLADSGLPRGPLWATAFDELERRQLNAELLTRADALPWLHAFCAKHVESE